MKSGRNMDFRSSTLSPALRAAESAARIFQIRSRSMYPGQSGVRPTVPLQARPLLILPVLSPQPTHSIGRSCCQQQREAAIDGNVVRRRTGLLGRRFLFLPSKEIH